MNKLSIKIILFSLLSNTIMAQLSGIYNVPGTYSSVAAAITDLNTQGVSGATTIQISTNYTETVTMGGFSLTATGTAANPITFKKNGTGANPLLIAYSGGVGTPTTAIQDGIWRLIGSDYITIDGIDLLDQNTSNPATMEFGIGLFKASTTDGCRNNTIKNCVITLNRINNVNGAGPVFEGSKGIEVINSLVSSHTLAVTVAAGSGANSNNQFFTNTIQNCNIGIALSGATVAITSANIDANNDIGGNLTTTGNTILNYGAGISSNSAYAIRALNQQSLNVAYNAINTNTNSGVALHGIYLGSTHNMTVVNNTVTINGRYIDGIYTNSGCLGTSANISNNRILNCGSTSTLNSFYAIYCGANPDYLNLNNNLISGMTFTACNAIIYGIHLPNTSSSQCTVSVASNTIENMSNLPTSNAIYGIYLYTGYRTTYTIQSNIVNNLGKQSGSTGALYGLWNSGNYSLSFNNDGYITNNIFTNLNNGGSANNNVTYGIYYSTWDYTGQYLTGNLVDNIIGGTGDVFGAFLSRGDAASAVNNNTITNITASGNIYGVYYTNNTWAAPVYMNGNTIGGLASAGSSTVFAIRTTNNRFSMNKNKIYDLSSNGSGSAYVYGISSIAITGTLSNNVIGDLRTPNSDYANAITGILIEPYSGATGYELYYNTVRIGAVSSLGIYFGSSALSIAVSAPTLTLRNNILINLSIPNGGSSAIAFKRSALSLSTYSSTSNNNLFYAGTPSTTNLIYSDGTNNIQTLSAFKTLVSPREAASVTENTSFLSTTGTSANFLHVSPPSIAESNAVNIPGITNDIDGNIRHGNTGYIGNGTAPDIGADEFGTPLCSTVNSSTITPTTLSVCAGQSVTLTRTATPMSVFAGTQLQWQRSASTGGPYTLVAVASSTSTSYTSPTLTPGTYYYTFASTCSVSNQTAVSNEVTVSVYPYPQPTVSPSNPVICSGSSSSVILTATGANQFTWSPSITLSANNGSVVTANPVTTTTYIVMGINPGGCTGTKSFTVSVYSNPTVSISGNTLVCAGTNVNLSASGANSYSWSNGSTQTAISPIVTSLTVYSVVGTSTLGNCTSTAQHTVSINPNPTLTASGGTMICAGQSATLFVSGANTYLWSNNATTSSISVTPIVTTVYNVVGTFTTTGCSSSTQQVVTLIPIPLISISGSNKTCLGQTLNLTASGATNYTWNTGSTSSAITVTPTSNTSYSVVGVSGPGCSGSAIKTISVDPVPTATITSATSSIICEDESIQLVATSDIGNVFNWSNGTNSGTLNILPSSNASYSVIVKISATNCTNSAVYEVILDPCLGINKIPQTNLLKLLPNPFHTQFTIDWQGQNETPFEIFDAIGNLIMRKTIQTGRNEINMEKFAKGIYYVKVNTEVQKIISD